jgi:hypothetical protein
VKGTDGSPFKADEAEVLSGRAPCREVGMSYYSQPSQFDPWRFAFGLFAGLLLAGSVWAVWWFLDRDDDPPHGTNAATATQSPPSATTGSPAATMIETCRAVFAAQADPLANGAPALAQWQVHIGAMNRLVTGAITLDQASAFWENTRVGAYAHLRDFQAANEKYAARTLRCPGPASVQDAREVRRCATAVAARHRAIRALGTALGTWAMHVHHMDMLRDGLLTPEQAEQMWLASWQAGVGEVRAYQAAQRETNGLHC